MKNRKKLLVLILSVMMIFTLMPTAVFAEGDEPIETPKLETGTLWAGTESLSSPHFENVDASSVKVTNITSSNTDVLKVECIGDPLSLMDYLLMPVSPGTAVITVAFTLDGAEYTASGEYTVKAFPVFLSSLAIDGEAISPEAYNYHNYYNVEGYKGTSPNVKFTVAEGWNFDNAYYNRMTADGRPEEGFLGTELPEGGWTFDFPEGYTSLNTFYVFKNDAGDEIQFGIRFYKAEDDPSQEEPALMPVDFYDTTGNLTWYWIPEYGPTTYELRITNAGRNLPEAPCATKYIDSGDGPFYFMIYKEISNLLNMDTLTRTEAYHVSLSAVNQKGKVFQKWEIDNLVFPMREFTDDTVSLDKTVFPYTGNIVSIAGHVMYNGVLLSQNDYSMNYTTGMPKNIGDVVVIITGYENNGYYGSVTKTYKIKGDLAGKSIVPKVTLDSPEGYVYEGKPVEPAVVSVTFLGQTLTAGEDYVVSYSDNDAPGTGYVIITAVDDSYYMGSKEIPFTITGDERADQTISAKLSASKVAVGKTATIAVTGAEGEVTYKSSDTTIATVSAAGKVTAKKVGTAKITVTAAETDRFKAATTTVTVKVVPAATSSLKAKNLATGIKITWKKVTGATGYKVYRGSTLVKTIASGSTVTYTDKAANTNGTKYVFKVVAKAGTGDSTLSKSVTTYRVSRPAISSLTNSAAGKMTVKWAKNAKATGYEIMYSTSKSFASGNKTVKITSKATVSKVIGSLTKGKTYYVKIRTYKTVSGTKYYSAWSAVKNVKISK